MTPLRLHLVRALLPGFLLASGAAFPLRAVPPVPHEDLFRLGFAPPEAVLRHLEDLGLDEGTMTSLRALGDALEQEHPPLEQAVQTEREALETLVRNGLPTAEEAAVGLDRLLAAEARVKHLQLRAVLETNRPLSPEQRQRVIDLTRQDLAREAEVQTKTKRLQTAMESLGADPTPALKARGQAISALLDSGRFALADEALDRLIADTGLEELDSVPLVEFHAHDPGATDLETLRQRHDAVQRRIEGVIRLPLLKQLVQAKDELEAAKAAEDAAAVGRILTWAESVLP
jgi:hypothetical protein